MKISFKHLREVDQTYTEHAKDALSVSFKLLKSSLAVLVHAFYPDVFSNYATQNCKDVYEQGLQKRETQEDNENEQTVLLKDQSMNTELEKKEN